MIPVPPVNSPTSRDESVVDLEGGGGGIDSRRANLRVLGVETTLLCLHLMVRVGRHLSANHAEEGRDGAIAVTLELLLVSIGEILTQEVEVGDVLVWSGICSAPAGAEIRRG